jgi:NADH-quinone oxidoreductase subunit N
LKRLIIFSAIVNNTYFLLALSNFSFLGLESFFIYMFFYLITIFGIFLVLLSLRDFSNFSLIKKIYSLKYFAFINLYCSVIFSSFFFSLAGIPPLLGFFGKFFIFYSVLDLSLFFITFLFILLSVFSVFYYLRLINLMFFSTFSNFFYLDF